MPRDETITVEGARLIFRNFEGKEGQYNREGDRNFGLILPHDIVDQLIVDGWNVKHLKPREEGDEPQPWLPVSLGWGVRPPKIILIGEKSRSRNTISEDTCGLLDWVEDENVDLTVRAYHWNVGPNSGIKAYLKTMYVTVAEDGLDLKYATEDDLPSRSGRVEE